MREILRNHTCNNGLECRKIDAAGPNQFALVRAAKIPVCGRIVVCPHQVKFQLVDILGLEVSIVERAFQEGFVFKPVPVKNHHVDTMAGSGVNFLFHRFPVVVHLISPCRHTGLVMAFPFRLAVADAFPFALTAIFEKCRPTLVKVTRGPIERRHIVFFCFVCICLILLCCR